MLCQGQSLPILQYQALYALIGTKYGGTPSTFLLPDLRGRVPHGIVAGQYQNQGVAGGAETVSLTPAQMPSHHHTFTASTANGTTLNVAGALYAQVMPGPQAPYATAAPLLYGALTTPVTIDPASIQNTGSGAAHANIQPFLVVNYMIAVQGVFPQRP